MEQTADDAIRDWFNLAPATAMALVWLAPLVLFWGLVFGHLRPNRSPPIDRPPTIHEFFLGGAASLFAGVLPRSYYATRNAARARRNYERLGVRFFKRFVVNGDLVNRWSRRHDVQPQLVLIRGDIAPFIDQTCRVERAHLVLFLFSLFTAACSARLGWYRWTACLVFGNIVFNLYPIFLQRYNRARARLAQLHPTPG